jgi:hypothetical protein
MTKKMWIWAAVSGVALLAAAAFFTMRLIHQETPARLPGGLAGSQTEWTEMEVKVERSDMLPEQKPDLLGTMKERDDHNLLVNQIIRSGDGSFLEGPQWEVVIPQDAQVYQDLTMQSADATGGGQVIDQVLEPGSAEDIQAGDVVIVWGDRRGDRLIAGMVVYTPRTVGGG